MSKLCWQKKKKPIGTLILWDQTGGQEFGRDTQFFCAIFWDGFISFQLLNSLLAIFGWLSNVRKLLSSFFYIWAVRFGRIFCRLASDSVHFKPRFFSTVLMFPMSNTVKDLCVLFYTLSSWCQNIGWVSTVDSGSRQEAIPPPGQLSTGGGDCESYSHSPQTGIIILTF